MRKYIFLVIPFIVASMSLAPNANDALLQAYARDPATQTCAAILFSEAGQKPEPEITGIKLVRNYVTISYRDDSGSGQMSCYFDREADGDFRLSYPEYFKGLKQANVDLPMSVGDLAQKVGGYQAIASQLPFYPIAANSTMLSDVTP